MQRKTQNASYFSLKTTHKWHLKDTGWVVLLFKSTNLLYNDKKPEPIKIS